MSGTARMVLLSLGPRLGIKATRMAIIRPVVEGEKYKGNAGAYVRGFRASGVLWSLPPGR